MSAEVPLEPVDEEKIRALAKRMMKLFVGSKTLHYTADFRNVKIEKGGKRVPQYDDVAGEPTLDEFIAHLMGKKGLLVIPITKIGACRWGKLDCDNYSADPKKYAALVARWGLPLVVELTKSGGFHLGHYSPYTETSHDIRAKLADWGAALHLKPSTEIFPKQERLMDGEKGSGINLPYFGGDDPATRNYAIDKDGNRLTVEAWLGIIERMPAKAAYVPGTVNVEAAADLLAKHWTDGQRDNINLAAYGTLIRAGVEHQLADDVVAGAKAIAADTSPRADAGGVEKMMEAGKRVPGFPRLAELMGQEEAREFMRLVGGKAPVKKLPFDFAPTPSSWRTEAPAPLTYTVKPLLPTGVVGMLVAEGGAGKSTFGLRLAIAVAGGAEFFGLPTQQGRVVYIAAEEQERGLRRRYHWIVRRERDRMMKDGCSIESIEEFEAGLDQNLTVRSAVGYEIFLIESAKGGAAQGSVVQEFIDDLPRPLELLILDPISRLHNAEENSNQVGTLLINSAERIAREVETTVLLAHHTGKSAAKERDTGMYSARGASALADAARSSIRLIVAEMANVKDFTNVPPGVIEAGDLVQVIHNKSNEGPKAKPFWLRRQELDFELFEPVSGTAGGVTENRKLLDALYCWWSGTKNNRNGFSTKRFEDTDALRDMFAPLIIGKGRARTVVEEALANGDLVNSTIKAYRSNSFLLLFRADFELEM